MKLVNGGRWVSWSFPALQGTEEVRGGRRWHGRAQVQQEAQMSIMAEV